MKSNPPNLPNLPPLLTIQDVANYLRICTKTVRRKVKTGEITAHRVGSQYRISERELRAYLARAG